MIKKTAMSLIGSFVSDAAHLVVGCSYSVALVLGTIFIILWILGWKKGLSASVWTLAIYAVINIFGGLL